MSMNETKLAQPYHFTVKPYAQRKDGKVPFSVETSVHLSADQIDSIGQTGDPVAEGIAKMTKLYTDLGYTEVTKCDAPTTKKEE